MEAIDGGTGLSSNLAYVDVITIVDVPYLYVLGIPFGHLAMVFSH